MDMSEKLFFPGIVSMTDKEEERNLLEAVVQRLFPLFSYVEETVPVTAEVEDTLTYEMILEAQANDEYTMSEDLTEVSKETIETQVSSVDMSMERLKDFNYLLSTFYTVDSTTMIGEDQLNVDDLLKYDMHINNEKEGPKVLIFHTHSQEAFVDSVAGDSSTTIVGMGAYLSEQLNAKGIETIHHAGVYDLINGKLDRSKAYQMAETGVKEILNQYPSIEVVIDLHRDGVGENTHLVTTVDGKQTAKIMFFNGLSRTKSNGDIDYLYNPYIDENLSFSFQMQLAAENLYPGFARRIYLKGYRYSLHMMPKSLLIEAGAQTNTVQEMKNAMDLLANVLVEVLL
ncbi:MAG: stage II sporulation protein P [Tyzzerella sp.]|nr:stage II sporulation protein P [Tyzzerella sp.]